MRKPTIIVFVALLLVSASVAYLDFGQSNGIPAPPKTERPLFPNESAYNQRAYPDQRIDTRLAQAAWADFKQQRTGRSSSMTGSWELEGPLNTGGRVTCVVISPVDDDIFYIGTPVGGIFRTQDAGESWEPIFDGAGRPSIGSMAIAPSDDQRIYVGTGEANGSGSTGAFFGDGMYRSDDGGDSWSSIGLPDSHHIGRIVVDPQDADRLFAATTGVLYGTSSSRGLYRSEDGGANWDQVLYVSDSTACIDVVMHPTDTDTLYAAMWERVRSPWARKYGGVTSAIHRSIDGGESWELLGSGLPAPSPETGRIGLAISQSEPNVVYASYTEDVSQNLFSGLYRSDDHGTTWSLDAYEEISDVNLTFGWYFGNVRVHPDNANDVHVLGQKLYRRYDGGTYWELDEQMHVDFHDLVYSPNDPDFMLCGNDGGLYRSDDGGSTWDKYENLPITQFYHIEVDEMDPDRLFGGTQDNNTLRRAIDDLSSFEPILGGDGFQVNVDPTDNDYVYAEYQYGNLFRSEWGGNYMEYALYGVDEADRNNWNTPVIISPYDASTLYYGTQRLYRSDDRALSWYSISDDLTDGPQSGSTSYGTLTSIAASGLSDEVVFVGSDDGNVSYTYDGGENWTTVAAGLPDLYVTGLAIDPTDDQVVYVTYSGFRQLDYAPHIFKTSDGGETWVDVNGNLPNAPINDILIQSEPHRLFVATDMAVWYSEDDGVNWSILGDDLPPTVMSHLQYHEPSNMLYIGTYGRSIHSYDLTQLDDFIGLGENGDARNALTLFPNPAADVLNIRFELPIPVESYFISDASGTMVLRGTFSRGEVSSVDVSALAPGVHVLHAADEGVRVQRRFVVSR